VLPLMAVVFYQQLKVVLIDIQLMLLLEKNLEVMDMMQCLQHTRTTYIDL